MTGNILKLLAIIVFTLMIFGCAILPEEYVSELVSDGGFHDVNGVFHDNRTNEIGSSAALSGSTQRRLSLDELVLRATQEIGSVHISIYTLSEQTSPIADRIIGAIEEGSEVQTAFLGALAKTIEPMANNISQGLRISLIIVSNRSGLNITMRSDRATSPLPLAFLAPVFPEHEFGSDSIETFWLQQATMLAHELLHLEYRLAAQYTNSKLRSIDEETAASLTNWCTEARFTEKLIGQGDDYSGKNIGFPSALNFPGIYRGEFSPDTDRIKSLGHPTSVGKKMARAIVFYLVADGETTINLADAETMAPLYALCDKLPSTSIPRFTLGEIPLG